MCAVKMKLKIESIGILTNTLQPSEMGAIYLMGMGMTMPNEVTKQDLIRVISVICKELKWIEDEENKKGSEKKVSKMEVKLKLEAIEILTSVLQPNEMGAIYMMAMGKAMPDDVMKEDLTKIISVLCKKLNWVEKDDEQSLPKKKLDGSSSPNTSIKDVTNGNLVKTDPLETTTFKKSVDDIHREMHAQECNTITNHSYITEMKMETSKIASFQGPEEKSNVLTPGAETPIEEKPYTCYKCDATFSREHFLEAHNFMKHEEKSAGVDKISKKNPFPRKKKHKNNIRINKKQTTCPVCDKSFKHSHVLETHMRLHSGEKPFKCLQCDKSYNALNKLRTHEKNHLAVKPFGCSFCDMKFARKDVLQTHERIHTNERPYTCNQCEKTFRQHSNMMGHIKRHAKVKPKPFSCHQCDKQFLKERGLRRHERSHLDKPFSCSVCNVERKFVSSEALEYHHKKKHASRTISNGEKSCICSVCGQTCKTSLDLKKHIWRIHNDEKSHNCSKCSKQFKSSKELDLHDKRAHTGEKPYCCPKCGLKFVQSMELKYHDMRIHTGEKPRGCTKCTKKYVTTAELKSHILRAHPSDEHLSCLKCKKKFLTSVDLKLHEIKRHK